MSITPVSKLEAVATAIVGQVKTLDDLPLYSEICKEWHKATGQELLRRCALIAQRLSICGKQHTLPDNCQEYVLRTTSEVLSRFRQYDPFESLKFSLKMQYIEEATFIYCSNRSIRETGVTLLEKQHALLSEIDCNHHSYPKYQTIILYMFTSNLEKEAFTLLDKLPEDPTVERATYLKCDTVSALIKILVSQNRIKDAANLLIHYFTFESTIPQLSLEVKKGRLLAGGPAWLRHQELYEIFAD